MLYASQASPHEVERRKRRRERNKIAAAKCRNKKKEKTESLQKVLFSQQYLSISLLMTVKGSQKVPQVELKEADMSHDVLISD